MRYPQNIALREVAVHILDSREGGSGLRLSNGLLPFAGDNRLTNYLNSHIRLSLNDTTSQAAKFVTIEADKVSGVCDALHANRARLIDGSRFLAETLYNIMLQDKKIKAGVLATCFYEADDDTSMARYLGLLKIDLGEVFRTRPGFDDQGNEIVVLEVDREALTTPRERLQKAAFLRALDPRSSDYDMILLDRQTRPDQDESGDIVPTIAKFFIEDFLGAVPALDAKEQTRRFHKSVIAGQNQLRRANQLSPVEEDALNRAMEAALTSNSVNIQNWIEGLPLPAQSRETLRGIVVQEEADMEFVPDEVYVRRALRKVRYIGDSGLRVSVNADQADNIISVNRGREGLREYYEVVLRTERWDKLTR